MAAAGERGPGGRDTVVVVGETGGVGGGEGAAVMDTMVAELVADLSRSPSGISFVYRTLDLLVRRHGLRDAALVVDDARAGRQVFRVGRGDPRTSVALGDPLGASLGLHLDPPLEAVRLSAVAELCNLGFQLDLRRHDASHDPLTGLYNRRSFDELLSQSASQAARYGWPFSLVILDMDHFKEVNDRHGHAAGDQILRLVGVELRGTLRSGDAAARIGGDEFALILANAAPDATAVLIERLRRSINGTMGFDAGFSCGVAQAPQETTDPPSLLALADRRLYEAKGRSAGGADDA
ncbi:MAG: GGDEF domain-containing protein [Acidimicrobiales bacterium]